jgi:hypothetical protein
MRTCRIRHVIISNSKTVTLEFCKVLTNFVKEIRNLTYAFIHLLLIIIKCLSFELWQQSRLRRGAWSKRGRFHLDDICPILEIRAKFTTDSSYK